MKVFKSFPALVRIGLLLYFLVPYFIFVKYFNFDFNLDINEVSWAVKNSSVQSLLAAAIVSLLSIFLSRGLLSFGSRTRDLVGKLLLLPQILPALFSILIAFAVLNPFPVGTYGIVFIFALIHLGFASVLLAAATENKLSSYDLNSEIFGIRRFTFFRRIYFPILKYDLLTNFLLVFIFCFTSFSVPLVAGGVRGTNLEVLIFEKIFISQNWSAAWTMSILQSIFIFALSFFILKSKYFEKSEFNAGKYLKSRLGIILIFIYLAIYIGGYLRGFIQALPNVSFLSDFSGEIYAATFRTLQLLSFYLVACFALLGLWIYDFVQNGQHHISRHLLSTSTILVGFAFYLLFPSSSTADYFKMTFALSILFFPALFKSFLEKPLDQLRNQILVAKMHGILPSKIVATIVLRQIQKPIFLWLSFLVIWFLSDFAIVKALGLKAQTLGLLAESFLSSYRLSSAYLISFYILFLWFVVMFVIYLIAGVFNVVIKKSQT